MMKQEFEKLAGREVSSEVYAAIEALYVESSLSKKDFIGVCRQLLQSLAPVVNQPNFVGGHVWDGRAWRFTWDLELLDTDIASGRATVRYQGATLRSQQFSNYYYPAI